MGKLYDHIDERLARWIEAQPLFFVGTAPSGDDGHVNVSPKGGADLFKVTGPHGFAYVDLFGSGIETVAHLRENGRIVILLAAFDGPPKIVRLHGRGAVRRPEESGFAEALAAFTLDERRARAVRSVIEVDVTRVSDSCGFVVPRMELVEERSQLFDFADARIGRDGPEAITKYVEVNNRHSIDGIAGLDAPVTVGEEQARRLDHRGRKL